LQTDAERCWAMLLTVFMVGMECGRADSSEWHARHAGA